MHAARAFSTATSASARRRRATDRHEERGVVTIEQPAQPVLVVADARAVGRIPPEQQHRRDLGPARDPISTDRVAARHAPTLGGACLTAR